MPAKWHKYSYSAQRAERRSILSLISLLFLLFIFFVVISNYVYTTYRISSETMEPALQDGDFVITTPLVSTNISSDLNKASLFQPLRGDLIVLTPAYQADLPLHKSIVKSFVSFLTLQKIKLFEQNNSWGQNMQIRRIIGFPGDSIYVEDFVVHVKSSGSNHFLTEFELAERDYDIRIDELPENWNTSLPFSGYYPVVTLSADEFFVMCDNRLNGSDSRVWGPIQKNRIGGKVIFRYWPFSKFGKP